MCKESVVLRFIIVCQGTITYERQIAMTKLIGTKAVESEVDPAKYNQ